MSAKLMQIQGIRALAMLGIFIAHITMWLPDALSQFAPLALRLGGAGVATFFIISGFLMAYKHKTIPVVSKRNVVRAAWKKAGKMYVLYIITIFVCLASRLPSSAYDWLVTSIYLIFHVTLTQDFIPFAALINSFNAPAWYLSAFFGIWILIYMFPRAINAMMDISVRQCVVWIAALMTTQLLWMLLVKYGISVILPKRYLAWCHCWLVYNNPIICFSEFCVGVLLGRFCIQKQMSIKLQNLIALLTLCVAVTYAIAITKSIIKPMVAVMVIAECLACAGILAVMSPKSIGYKMLSTRALVWFGNVSGYFFLIHTAVIFMMRIISDYVCPGWLILISFTVSALLASCAAYVYELTQNNKKTNVIII